MFARAGGSRTRACVCVCVCVCVSVRARVDKASDLNPKGAGANSTEMQQRSPRRGDMGKGSREPYGFRVEIM
jgi:hypothetical protein